MVPPRSCVCGVTPDAKRIMELGRQREVCGSGVVADQLDVAEVRHAHQDLVLPSLLRNALLQKP